MNCPNCGCQDRVMRTRRENGTIIRTRRCPKCGHSVTTEEKPVEETSTSSAGDTSKAEKSSRKNRATAKSKAADNKPKGALAQAMAGSD